MTRTERVVTILSYATAVLVLLAVLRVFGGAVGAVEILGVLLLALPLSVVFGRRLRVLLARGERHV